MAWKEFINPDEIRKTIKTLKPNGEPFEIRIISSGQQKPLSGYFQDAETLLKKFQTVNLQDCNVYITLNQINPACMSRSQHEKFLRAKVTTSDSDIDYYRWLFVDLDPVRMSDTSSSDAELKAAEQLAAKVCAYMDALGFEKPVKALSGNGCHLLYGIWLENTPENRDLIQQCLQVLADMFDTDQVKIDTTNYNPARICKLHGTVAQKGADTPERPHRLSRIFSKYPVKGTSREFLEKLASQLPRPEQTQKKTNSGGSGSFDLETFLAQHELTYTKRQGDRAVIYSLDHCPFDHNHTNGDSKIFLYPNGAIAFKCHHNSCAGKKWQDVRKLFEPDAYDRPPIDTHIEDGWREHNRNKQQQEVTPPDKLLDTNEMFRTMEQILEDPEPKHEFVRCGIKVIDASMGGLEKTGVSVISGLRASGKSTLIGQIILQAINDRHNVVCYSGELNNHKYIDWLMRQAAGKTNVIQSAEFRNVYDVPKKIQKKISDWSGECFWLYNNRYGNKFSQMITFLQQKIIDCHADICIIDNLMALDISDYANRDKYEAQTNFVWALKNLAEVTNTHIIFVAHPRKANGFLRLSDISGSGNISNIVDNAFIIHRWNKDFENGYRDYFKEDAEKDIPKCTNVIEIAKDREGGMQDEFIPLWYEESTKRLRNSPDEHVVYGWDDSEQKAEGGFLELTDDQMEDIPFGD